MKRLLIILLILTASLAKAQTSNTAITEHDATVKAKDAQADNQVIQPALEDADGEEPDWKELTGTLTQKYDAATADRVVTKAKIYFYYSKDWASFCEALIHYTNNYELANDYDLLDKNARMILTNSQDTAQWKAAQQWAKLAVAGSPGNTDFAKTLRALNDKIAGK